MTSELDERPRHNTPGAHRPPQVGEASRDLDAEVLAEHVERVLKAAPKLSEAQVANIVALLQSTA